jgi:hypothetical protein
MNHPVPGAHITRRLPLTNYERLIRDVDFPHAVQIRKRLAEVGVGYFGLTSPEAHYLPHIIHPDEIIEGAVYGRSAAGIVMMVATDRRIIYLDKKPLFIEEEEVVYEAVGGISHGHLGLGSVVFISTRMKNYRVQTSNERSASIFVEAIEKRCVEHIKREDWL